jgi:hypothetical protein
LVIEFCRVCSGNFQIIRRRGSHRSLSKTAREGIALFFRLVILLLLESLFVDARTRGASALEEYNDCAEEKQGLLHKVSGNLPRLGHQSTRNLEAIDLTSRQIFLRQEQSLDPPAPFDSIDDFRHVRHGHPAVEKMVGFNQNCHAGRALVEATTGTDARLQFGEAPLGELILQGLPDLFCAASSARSAGIFVGPAVGADEDIMLTLRHTSRFVLELLAVN